MEIERTARGGLVDTVAEHFTDDDGSVAVLAAEAEFAPIVGAHGEIEVPRANELNAIVGRLNGIGSRRQVEMEFDLTSVKAVEKAASAE